MGVAVQVTARAFDPDKVLAGFGGAAGSAGAIVTFRGIVRSDGGDPIDRLEIEHYPGMTERAITEMAQEAADRWQLADCLVIHRHGSLGVGEVIMMVATAARHRQAAFEAAEFLMDYLKSRAPFWKKEFRARGAEWVAARETDEQALGRWDEA